ncbi:MAG TPA: hypothetical protein VIL72_14400 [Beijerinckiaceae bacterium]|jgi:CHASE1-domain containing sensor protein
MRTSASAILAFIALVTLGGASLAQSIDQQRQRLFEETQRTLDCCQDQRTPYAIRYDGVLAGDADDE